MSVEVLQKIDAIGIDKYTENVVLTISDHLDWSDTNGHLFKLQEKINVYLSFIESGELVRVLPKAKGKRVIIDICGICEINDEAECFLKNVSETLEPLGFVLRHRIINAR